jgi:hypothetical protein
VSAESFLFPFQATNAKAVKTLAVEDRNERARIMRGAWVAEAIGEGLTSFRDVSHDCMVRRYPSLVEQNRIIPYHQEKHKTK